MESMRSTWTDSRLDDFANRTDSRLDELSGRMDEGFRELRGEISGLKTTMVQTTVALAVGMLAGFGGLAGLIATQL
jgi:hypothetical protein